ncbi:DNA glycosylase, partial [Peziza echinospora]
FRSISRGIIAQQVSNAAAASILAKFDALFSNPSAGSEGPTPQEVLAMPIETLRSAGLSGRKAEYMHSLSNFFTTQYNSLPNNTPFTALSDEAIIDLLVTVKGIGRWSAQMFLLFGMGRWDVFAGGDLGIQRGIAVWKHGKEGGEKFAKTKPGKGRFLSDEKLAEIVGPFTPYRSLLCLLLWRVGDTRVD